MGPILPEKTVEIWTGIAVSRFLPAAEIWSPTNYAGSVDQWIRAGKTWAFELKTTYDSVPPTLPIDPFQLWRHAFAPRHDVPVLYVLPLVPWHARPFEPVPAEASMWHSFPWWSRVVSATRLARRLGVRRRFLSTGPLSIGLNDPWITSPRATLSLALFLVRVGACNEPKDWTLRRDEETREEIRREAANDIDPEGNYFLVRVPADALPLPVTGRRSPKRATRRGP